MRLIDADALEELFREVIGAISQKPEMTGALEHMVRASAMIIEMINDAPTIEDVQPVVHGEWIDGTKRQTCSICRYRGARSWAYCPSCGAKMETSHE